MPLKKTAGSKLNPSGTMSRNSSQQQITANAAAKYNVSAAMLWGIYGTESFFGTNPSTSSAGAQGPMQFIPSTWAQYGGGGNVQDLAAAMPAAAHYLHDLGATTNINDPKTIAAINAYNGNGGGSSPDTAYYQSVTKYAQQWSGAGGSTAAGASTTASGTAAPSSSSSSGGGSLLDILNDIVTGDIEALAATLAMAGVTLIKDLFVGFGDLVIIPLWHRNQDAVWYYYSNVLFNKDGNHKPYETLPITAAFWGLGYALLFVDPESGSLKAAPVRKSRVARHVRRLQAVPAKRTLIKPRQVKANTPTKPEPKLSKVKVNQIGTMTATRKRPITVEGGIDNEYREYDDDRAAISEVPVKQVSTEEASSETGPARAKSHQTNPDRQRPLQSGRGRSSRRPT